MTHAKPTRRSALLDSRGAERVAAVLALLTLAGAIVFLLAGVIRNWAGVLLALAGLVVAVVAGWDVVSRRGAVRVVALVVAAAAVALVVWGLAISDFRPVRVVLILVLAAVSVGAPGWHCAAPGGRDERVAGDPVLIMNPRSGGGKAERFHLAEECRTRGIEPIVLQPGDASCNWPRMRSPAGRT